MGIKQELIDYAETLRVGRQQTLLYQIVDKINKSHSLPNIGLVIEDVKAKLVEFDVEQEAIGKFADKLDKLTEEDEVEEASDEELPPT